MKYAICLALAPLFSFNCLAADSAPSAPPLAKTALHPWQVPAAQQGANVYFTNLKSGDSIETPFLLKFGLSGGWGLAPIANPIGGKTGHHHLLINRDLPLNFKEALPFNDQYIHFGKGQMETTLTLAPGTYSLRLLLADGQHIPHFIYSKPTLIKVVKNNGAKPAVPAPKGLEMEVDQSAGESAVKNSFLLRFHASGLNVAHRDQGQKDSGHFKLTMAGKGNETSEMNFIGGETEVRLAPPAGEYQMKLEFIDNLDSKKALADPVVKKVTVP